MILWLSTEERIIRVRPAASCVNCCAFGFFASSRLPSALTAGAATTPVAATKNPTEPIPAVSRGRNSATPIAPLATALDAAMAADRSARDGTRRGDGCGCDRRHLR
jgi:hypothetical protein